jgi:two-component system response regulator DctR
MLHVVDDEIDIQEALGWMAKSKKLKCAIYSSGEELLDALNIQERDNTAVAPDQLSPVNLDPDGDSIILDIRMGGMSGISTFDIVANRNLCKRIPVIFITGHGEISIAVEALKRGAFDFFEKPFNDHALFEQVDSALMLSRKEAELALVYKRFARLTAREREILDLILVGKMNKVIADKLRISMRTVEVHRANILDKMEVKTAIELAPYLK